MDKSILLIVAIIDFYERSSSAEDQIKLMITIYIIRGQVEVMIGFTLLATEEL